MGEQYKNSNSSNELSKKESRAKLQKIYEEKGANSEEFYEAIKNLLSYLMGRYLGRYDEDCLSECYLRLLDSFKYWDSSKSNIISWVHMVVRNKISAYCYTYKKNMNEGYAIVDNLTPSPSNNDIQVRDMLRTHATNLKRVDILIMDDFYAEVFYRETHPFFRSALWEATKEKFKCQKKFNIGIRLK